MIWAEDKGWVSVGAGGRNGPRLNLWKLELQKLAYEIGLLISVSQFPPGTASGTRSSIASSPSSARTGAAGL